MARIKLTDKEKKKIIADYITNQNYSETGRMNNVSKECVRKLVKSNQDNCCEKLTQKKEENTQDILEYMGSIYEKQKNIIDLSLNALEDKLKKPDMFINVKDIATVYGVIFDKALKYKEIQLKNIENDNTKTNNGIITDLIGALKDVKKD